MMGRGIVESGLFRSERYGLEQRTSDPASTSEGEMWIRTDIAPDTNQLATLRFDAGGSTWDVPIYDVAATTENVEKVWRVPIGGTTGFVPITDDSPTFEALKFQHNGASFGAHDALTASAIPDSVVMQFFATTWDEGDGTWGDDATDDGAQDMGLNGGLTAGTLSDGSDALTSDGTDDVGRIPLPAEFEGSGLQAFSVEFAFDFSNTETKNLFGILNSSDSQRLSIQTNNDETLGGTEGNFVFRIIDTDGNEVRVAPEANPGVNDGNRHNVSIAVNDATNNDIDIIIDDSSVAVATGASGSPDNFGAWDDDLGVWARHRVDQGAGSFDNYWPGNSGAFRFHEEAIASQTISDYP